MIFSVYYIAALVLVIAEMRGLLRSRLIGTPKWPGWVWIAILAGTYALQVAMCSSIAASGDWPIAVVPWQEGATGVIAALLVTGLVQTFALLGLYRSGVKAGWVAVGAVVMAAVSFVPVMSNADLYAYVANGLLGRSAYLPPSSSFSGDLSAINVFWRAPMSPTTYGPLWIAVARVVTEFLPALWMKLFALRILGTALLAVLLLLLRAYGVPLRILSLLAVNPALYFEFVLNGHNDLLPACITLVAAIVAPGVPFLAALLIATAALAKAPFVLLGLPVLARVRSVTVRVATVVVAVCGALSASWIAGGAPYLRALQLHASSSHLENWLHVVAAATAVCALVAAVAGLRRLRSAVWLMPLLGAYTAAWYALWGLPYALGTRRVLVYFALWLPFVSMLTEPSLVRFWTLAVVVPVAVVASLAMPVRNRQPLQGGPS